MITMRALLTELKRLDGEAKQPNATWVTMIEYDSAISSASPVLIEACTILMDNLNAMENINVHLGYPFSQPLINIRKQLDALARGSK